MRRLQWLVVRTLVWSILLGVIAHAIVVAHQLPIARGAWSLYMGGPLMVGSLAIPLGLRCVLPGRVRVGTRGITIQRGQNVAVITPARLRSHRFFAVGERRECVVLALRHQAASGRPLRSIVVISDDVDLIALDDLLDRLRRNSQDSN